MSGLTDAPRELNRRDARAALHRRAVCGPSEGSPRQPATTNENAYRAAARGNVGQCRTPPYVRFSTMSSETRVGFSPAG